MITNSEQHVETVEQTYDQDSDPTNAEEIAVSGSDKNDNKKSSWFNWIWIPVALCVCLAIGTMIGGFVRFAESVASLEEPRITKQSDAIVVLTGGKSRIAKAVALLEQGKGQRLFISGVNPDISDSELRRVSGAQAPLFDCCIDVGRDAKDTIGNGKEIAQWAVKNKYKNLIVVTSNYHMTRSLLELNSALSDVDFTAYPVMNSDFKTQNWLQDTNTLRTLINEFVKLNLAYFRQYVGVEIAGNLYSEQPRPTIANLTPKIDKN